MKHKMVVFGHIKDVKTLFPAKEAYYNIHDLIKQLCTLYYAFSHEWDSEHISQKMELNEETNLVQQIKDRTTSSAFLNDHMIWICLSIQIIIRVYCIFY